MIVARIEGGLGNQFFQYAFGAQLASKHQTELVLDLTSYDSKPAHGYLLDKFSIEARVLRSDERKRLPGRYQSEKPSILKAFTFGGNSLRVLREKPFGFLEKYLSAPDNCFLAGYWQSERFFRDVSSSVRRQFTPCVQMNSRTLGIREQMLNTPSIAIHIRRGDYISTQPMAVRNLSLGYYRDCVLSRLEQRPESEVFVFSNDLPWCRDNLKLPCPVHFVEPADTASAHEDLWLMTAAECFVIANSTFSWWGAYLAERQDRIVYAPANWFHANTLDGTNILCKDWLRVNDPIGHIKAA